jgi:hypothetical protein
MKTINNISQPTQSTESANPLDEAFPPSKTFKRTFVSRADGIHGWYQLGDGKTTGHSMIPWGHIFGVFEAHDPNFKKP